MFDERACHGYFEIHNIQKNPPTMSGEQSLEEKKKIYKIPFNSMSYSITSHSSRLQYGNTNKASMSTITITRDMDYMSAHLAQSPAAAKISDCIIEFYKTSTDTDNLLLFLTYSLKDAEIVHVQHDLDNVTGEFKEVISISYSSMNFQYKPVHKDDQSHTRYGFSHSHDDVSE